MSRIRVPVLSVRPVRALVDEAFRVVLENLDPGSAVTLHSLHQSEDKDDWEAFGHYTSDCRGVVSVSDDVSVGGSYTGKEPMGLLWSMRPVPGSREGLRLRKREVCSPLLVNISAYSGHLVEGFRDRAPLVSVLAERWYVAPGVRRVEVEEKGVRGTLFIPPGPGPFPGMLDMWGGGGGLLEYRSALLASHGFVSLALEYFQPGERETPSVQQEYFESAFEIIRDHPQVMGDRIGILGLSLGAILTLFLTANSSVIKPQCCVCISGNHMFPRSTSIGQLFDIWDTSKVHVDENNHHVWREMFLPVPQDPMLKVDVSRLKCPFLLVNGTDDQNWPTVEYADNLTQMMHEAGNAHLLSRLDYPDTGHLIEPPYSPHFRASKFIDHNTGSKFIMLWGGRTKPHSDAQEDSWRKILAFFKLHLYNSSVPKAQL